MKSTRRTGIGKLLWTHVAPLLVWMLVIFLFSTQPYHKQDLRPWLKNTVPEQLVTEHFSSVRIHYGGSEVSVRSKGVPGFVEFFIRKGAHLFEYFVLGVLVFRLLLKLWVRDRNVVLLMAISLIFCSLYSMSDEVHQIFTPNRTPMGTDVLLDSTGAALGIVAYYMLKRKNRANSY